MTLDILKCVFMTGGPGSGKSFTTMEIFGIDKKLKSSFSNKLVLNQLTQTPFEIGLKKNGINPKDLDKNRKKKNQNYGIKSHNTWWY